MLKDITLGQFFPGDSILHKLDPRTKIILTLLYITSIFLATSVSGYIYIMLYTGLLVFISRIPIKIIVKGLRPLIVIIAFTAIINILWTKGEVLMVDFYFINIYLEGIMYALLMIIRITSLLAGTSVILTYTTSPIALTDGLERLLAPLKSIHLPVHEFAMMMTIALRFIPTLIEETDKIMNAQKARGADFSTGSLTKRAKALIPILIPLFISAFRRADELSTAMECRCYRGGDNRTRMTVLRMRPADFITIALLAMSCIITILLNINFPIYKI
ncbi:MAG: energy-coupling factor transporter transmembrane component T [Eubacteriales bacterium]|nr:energy-coupling factor transporter transmembrane component T [Eubacteriales bacterium]